MFSEFELLDVIWSREPGRRSIRIGDYFDWLGVGLKNKDCPEVNLRGSWIPYLEYDLSWNGFGELGSA